MTDPTTLATLAHIDDETKDFWRTRADELFREGNEASTSRELFEELIRAFFRLADEDGFFLTDETVQDVSFGWIADKLASRAADELEADCLRYPRLRRLLYG